MPTGAPCQPSCVPQPPRRFQSAAAEEQELPRETGQRTARTLVGVPAPRPSASAPARSSFLSAPSSPGSRSERSCALRPRRSALGLPVAGATPHQGAHTPGSNSAAAQSAGLTRSVSVGAPRTPCGAAVEARATTPTAGHGHAGVCAGATPPRAGPKTPSIMDLVNQAARQAEQEERRSMCRSASLPARLGDAAAAASSHGSAAAPPTPKQGAQQQQQQQQQQPASPPAAQQQQARSSSASPRASSGAQQQTSGSSHSSPRSGRSSSSSSSSRSASMPGTPPPSSGGLPPVSGSRSGGASAAAAATQFADARYQQAALVQHHAAAAAARAGSECGSEDGSLTPPGSSLCSSASSSSLCSAASYGSNASTSSGGSGRPKSILLTRSSTSSLGSGASSPRCIKRVTWKDGQAHRETGGRDLVAVRLLDDGPDMRRLRRDTWPERPGARREAAEEAAAAAAAAAKQQQAAAGPSSLARAIELLQEPGRLFDWRDKLKALQQERRAQRLGMVQAAWQAQQQQQQQEQQQQQPQQQQDDTEMTPADDDAELQAAAVPQGCGGKVLGGGAIRIEAVAASVAAVGGC